jgi:tetratricopeptide (TPR) repeat protein
MRFFAHTYTQLRHMLRSRRARLALIFLPVVVLVGLLAVRYDRIAEDIMFRYDHTAGRACRYGTKHLSANEPYNYDIERAQYFLEACRELDPTFPAVNYHLARLYFVQRHPIMSLMSVNAEIRVAKGEPIPEVYYMKGLIEGAIGYYDRAAEDYRTFLSLKPDGVNGWAGYNDYAWVLLKGGRTEEALAAITTGLEKHPGNAWLLTIKSTALFELGRLQEAADAGEKAVKAADALTEAQWRSAYPGNNPDTTEKGLDTIRRSARENLAKIREALARQ